MTTAPVAPVDVPAVRDNAPAVATPPPDDVSNSMCPLPVVVISTFPAELARFNEVDPLTVMSPPLDVNCAVLELVNVTVVDDNEVDELDTVSTLDADVPLATYMTPLLGVPVPVTR